MKDLIAALTIFEKYIDLDAAPTHCEHDVMYVMVSPSMVSHEDTVALEDLGFSPDQENEDCFRSYRFGSA